EQLGRVEAVAVLRLVGPVHAIAVARPRADAGQEAVPVQRRALAQVDPRLVVVAVEEAQLHALGVLREQREVGPVPVPGRAEGEGLARPDRAHLSSAPASGGSVTDPSHSSAPSCVARTMDERVTATVRGDSAKLDTGPWSPRRTRSQRASS